MNDLSILCSAASREYSRIPALVWKHPENHSVLVRGGPVSNILLSLVFFFFFFSMLSPPIFLFLLLYLFAYSFDLARDHE